jgi:hypothetical protein
MSPHVGFGPEGEAHAFWFQQGSDAEMHPHHGYLEYRVRDVAGTWSDEGDFLDPYEEPGVGRRVAMTLTHLGQPIFAWTDKDTLGGVPQPRRIVLARPESGLDSPDTPPAPGGPQLDAWPNPFNPRLTLAGSVPVGAAVSLAVFDLAGRRVATLPVRPDGGGRFTTSWDGTDPRGRAVAAGVYLARLATDGGAAVRRVVLAR